MRSGTLKQAWRSNFIRTIVPVGLTITLFFLAFFFVFVPRLEQSMMNERRRMVKELTKTAWELVADYHRREQEGELTTQEAQRRAAERLRRLRYGENSKDYFWINDLQPRLLMHPYRLDLENVETDQFADIQDAVALIKINEAAKEDPEGVFVEYSWQWRDDPSRKGAKQSYVKIFVPWGWVIGTGVYLDDVAADIINLKKQLAIIFGLILGSIGVISGYIVWQGGVSEKKVVEAVEALMDSERRYELVVQQSGQIIYDCDLETNIITWAGAIEEVTGYSIEEFADLNVREWADNIHPDDRDDVIKRLEDAKANKELPFRAEYRFRKKCGNFVYIEDEGGIVAESADQPSRLVGTMRDITERKESEARLLLKDNIIECASTGIAIGDLDGYVTSVNPAFLAMWHAGDVYEVVGLSYRELFNHENGEDHLVDRMMQLKDVGQWAGELRGRRLDGSLFDIQVSASVVRDKAHRPVCLMASSVDISDRKRAQAEREKLEIQLRQSQKMEAVGQLAGGIAHDFNNILTVILGNAELISDLLAEKKTGCGDAFSSGIQEIVKSAQRASSLTRQLLTFSRRQVAQPRVFDINAALLDMQKMLHRLLSEDIELRMKLSSTPKRVYADVGQIEQVIVNLAVNARDAMPHGGVITIRTDSTVLDGSLAETKSEARIGNYVVVEIVDTGCGMDETTVERIFEPFFTTKPTGQGTGLGLATVYGIVKQMNGHILVNSEVGVGTSFKILLPTASEKADTRRVVEVTGEPPTGDETVLLCEDNNSVRSLVYRMLRGAGYDVHEAGNAADALRIADDHVDDIRLLVTDVIMPDMNGCELSDALRKENPRLKTLFISGYSSNIIKDRGIEDGAVDYLSKPFDKKTFLCRVRNVLDG